MSIQAISTQSELNSVYRGFLDRLRDGLSGERGAAFSELSAPFLIRIMEEYASAEPRIAIVGQETYGWMDLHLDAFLRSRGIDGALAEYEKFDFGANYCSSPFWRRFHEVGQRLLGTRYNRRAVTWMNLFKCNHAGKKSAMIESPHRELVLDLQADIFQLEVRHLAPQVLIFFTGPKYNSVISRFYPRASFVTLGEYPVDQVARVRDDQLPELTFRTYHPGYIHWHKAARQFIDAIVCAAADDR